MSGRKQERLRSPFHLLHSEMKWPSQVCGGAEEGEEGNGVLRHLISPSNMPPSTPTGGRKQVRLDARVSSRSASCINTQFS